MYTWHQTVAANAENAAKYGTVQKCPDKITGERKPIVRMVIRSQERISTSTKEAIASAKNA
jgi:hypothetical protein